MFCQRSKDGKLEPTEVGGFLVLVLLGTFLAVIYAVIHSLIPTRGATSGGLVGMFILVPAQLGEEETWKVRVRILAYAFIGYAWCISLARVLVGGDMVLYAWGSLLIFTTALQWLWKDAKRRRRDETAQ